MSQLEPYDPGGPAGLPPMPQPHLPEEVFGRHLVAETDQRPVSGLVIAIAWVLAFLSMGYMLPWAIAATRGRSDQAAIGVVNLLLGWTLVGWIVALVMAAQRHRVVWQPQTLPHAP